MPSNDAIDSYELKGLDQITKALKRSAPVIRVGILGSNNTRGDGQSNATIGAAHEFGTTKIPQRSFLRAPLTNNLNRRLEKERVIDEESIKDVIYIGRMTPWLRQIAQIAEEIVQESFDEQGPGWAPWKNPSYHNNTGMILSDTQQLRRSITSEVKE